MTVQTQTPARHATRLTLALVAIAGLILATFYVASPVLGTHVAPQLFQGNPTCGTLNVAYDHEFKIQPVTGGIPHEDPDSAFEVTLTLHTTDDGPTFDWVSNLPVDAVFVKGGPGGNLYVYNGATSDTGLHAPGNDQGTAVSTPPWSGLSHLSFCFNDVPETPPPSVPGSVPASIPASVPASEGGQLGGSGTPAASLLNTALSLPGSGPLATLFFGAILIASLGALAYANVTAVRRRR